MHCLTYHAMLAGRIVAHFKENFVAGEEALGVRNGVAAPCVIMKEVEAAPAPTAADGECKPC